MDELKRINPKSVPGKTRYWALYAKTFYEDIFQKINDRNKLQKKYKDLVRSIKKPEARDALTFFYRIRRDELDKVFKWEQKVDKLRHIIREEIQFILKEKDKEDLIHDFYMKNLAMISKALEKEITSNKVKVLKVSPDWNDKSYSSEEQEWNFEHEIEFTYKTGRVVIPLIMFLNGTYSAYATHDMGDYHTQSSTSLSHEKWEIDDISIYFNGGYDDQLPTKKWKGRNMEDFAKRYIGAPS